jgi:hypothetical protein
LTKKRSTSDVIAVLPHMSLRIIRACFVQIDHPARSRRQRCVANIEEHAYGKRSLRQSLDLSQLEIIIFQREDGCSAFTKLCLLLDLEDFL